MALKIQAKDAEKIVKEWPVSIQEPLDGGKSKIHRVKVDYKILTDSQREALVAEGADQSFLKEVVRGWGGMQLDDGSEAACSDENKELFFDVQWIRIGFVAGYFEAASGGRRKN